MTHSKQDFMDLFDSLTKYYIPIIRENGYSPGAPEYSRRNEVVGYEVSCFNMGDILRVEGPTKESASDALRVLFEAYIEESLVDGSAERLWEKMNAV